MTVSADVLSTVIKRIEPEVSDLLTTSTPFLNEVKRLKKAKYSQGQPSINFAVQVYEHSSITQFSEGHEVIDLTHRDITRPVSFEYSRIGLPVIVSYKDKSNTNGKDALIDLAQERYKNALGKLYRALNKQFMTGASAEASNFLSLYKGSGTTHFFEAATGGTTNTVGGLAKSSVPDARGWKNQYRTSADATGANIIKAMRNLSIDVSLLRPDGGDGKAFHTVLLHPEAFQAILDAQFQGNVRYVDTKELDAGNFVAAWQGGSVHPDESFTEAAIGGSTSLASGDIFGYMLNLDDTSIAIAKDSDFAFMPFTDKVDQDMLVARVVFQGQLFTKNLGSSGILKVA